MSNRRDFILKAAAAGGALAFSEVQATFADDAASSVARPLHILMLGGAGFVGSHCARAAVVRGHKVAVFSRSRKLGLDLPDEVEVLVGDRNNAGDLDSIKNRDWDAVVDLAAFAPVGVRTFGQVFNGRVKHYTLISTVAVYERPKADGTLTENSPLLTYEGNESPYTLTGPRDVREYGALKVLCEVEADKQFPHRALILRPGYIAGPGEAQGQFAYWTLRMQKGGEALAAGDPSTPVQFVDARDLADWCIRLIEKRATGVYNVTGPAALTRLSQFINTAYDAVSASCKITWVPASWLAVQHDKEMWSKLLYWSLEADGWGWAMRMNIDRALADGLTFRPMNVTRADTFDWYRQQSAERQAELLSTRKKKEGGDGFDIQPVSWSLYLQREKEVLAAWHATQQKLS